ncbi:MAG: hypothetical protein OER92_09685, partial [Alphaproteobacteria bacterium]|nr:hypothetical protein [Alphaproteobacteria bacterium]
MAKFENREELEAWLNNQPHPVSVVIAARTALRVLPLLADEFSDSKLKPGAVAIDIVLPVFRAVAVSWSAAKYPNHATDLARYAATFNDALYGAGDLTHAAPRAIRAVARTVARAAAIAAAATTRATTRAAAAAAAADAVRAAVVAEAAFAAIYAADAAADAAAARAAIWQAISADATRMEGADAIKPNELSGEQLWSKGVPELVWESYHDLDQHLIDLRSNWGVWINWYEARLRGEPTYPHATAEQNEQLDIAYATIGDAIWKQGPAAVNAETQRLEKEVLGDGWEGEVGDDADGELAQGPGPYRYVWRSGKIEASPATDIPFDINLADEFRQALSGKLAETRGALTGNNADPPVLAAIDRLEPLLEGSAAAISIGLVYMRAVSLEAFTQAYADSSSERENNISAALADLSESLSALTACYPVIQTLEANRLAIDLQSSDAVAVESSLREIEDVATASEIAGESVVEALAIGREDVDVLSEKAEQSVSHPVRATYIEERGKLVAQRVLNVKNFVGEVLKMAGSEVSGLVGDSWTAARRGIPKGIEEGSKDIAKAGLKGGAIYLAFKLLGPLGGLSALVVMFQPFAKRAEKIAEEAENKKAECSGGEIDENHSD